MKLESESQALNVQVGNIELNFSEIWIILLDLYIPWKFTLVILLWSGPQ